MAQVFRSYLHLILDRSNSVQSAGAAEVQEGARQFIEAVTAEPENFVKISWFDGSPMIHEISGFDFGFSNDRELLLAAMTPSTTSRPSAPRPTCTERSWTGSAPWTRST